jgi:lipid-A-disaccharide synthase
MTLFMVAGEKSGDLHGHHLAEALLEIDPMLSIQGVAGPLMRSLGIRGSIQMEDLQVMGFTDVALALPKLFRLFYQVRDEILQRKPSAVVFIDYPGFNLRLARSLRKKGYQGKLIHFICPTVWAWGKRRIPLMAQTLDLLLTIFPFERASFVGTRLETLYVGHPLVKKIASRPPLPRKKLLALFPGSRDAVIQRNFPLQLQVARKLQALMPDIEIAISLSSPKHRALLQCEFPLIEPEHTYDLMQSAHLAIATSGTVTLELALFQTPTVVHYAIKPLDLFLAQKIFRINLSHYCIVNLLVKERIFPELFGPHFTFAALFQEVEELWSSSPSRKKCQEGCEMIRRLLGEEDASKTAAEVIYQTSLGRVSAPATI